MLQLNVARHVCAAYRRYLGFLECVAPSTGYRVSLQFERSLRETSHSSGVAGARPSRSGMEPGQAVARVRLSYCTKSYKLNVIRANKQCGGSVQNLHHIHSE